MFWGVWTPEPPLVTLSRDLWGGVDPQGGHTLNWGVLGEGWPSTPKDSSGPKPWALHSHDLTLK